MKVYINENIVFVSRLNTDFLNMVILIEKSQYVWHQENPTF